jgi:hypothetical protein
MEKQKRPKGSGRRARQEGAKRKREPVREPADW